MNEGFVKVGILMCFGEKSDHIIVGFDVKPPRTEGTIAKCPKCGVLAEWITWEHPAGSLFVWDEKRTR